MRKSRTSSTPLKCSAGPESLQSVLADIIRRRQRGDCPLIQTVIQDHPDLMPELEVQLRGLERVERAAASATNAEDASRWQNPANPTSFEARAGQSRADELGAAAPLGSPSDIAREWLARSLPGYEILGEIHHGAQGAVHEARQRSTGRTVAIKVIRGGPFCGPHEIARFQREVRILARLDHPNIVTILDSGATAGCLYYVMDRIFGRPLDEHVRDKRLSIEQIVRLFATVCEAVNAAHRLGIIHRDLKPGNVLVDDAGRPFLLDFGLATVQTGDDLAQTITLTGRFVGSLPWAAPEQVDAAVGPLDVRTDVYALGVVLYQALTGRFPYELGDGAAQMAETIRRVEPMGPRLVNRAIDGELETIALKCLSKEPQRRYQTAGELAADIRRYLRNEPILARPPNTWYQFRKFARRNRVLVGAVGATSVALLLGLTGTTYGLIRGNAQRAKAERIADFMERTFSGVGTSVALGRDTRMLREMMDDAAERIRSGELSQVGEAEIRLRRTIGNTYRQIAAYDGAAEMLGPAVELARLIHGEESQELAACLGAFARMLHDRGEARSALDKHAEALSIYRRLFPGDHPDVASGLNNVAACLESLGRSSDVLPKYEAALEMVQRLFPGDHPHVATGLNNVASCLQSLGRSSEALPKYEVALQMSKRLFPGDHPHVARSMNNVALCLQSLGRSSEALTKYEDALEMSRRLFPGDHPNVAKCLNNLAGCLRSLGRSNEALPMYEAALAMCQRLFPGDHPDVAGSVNNVAGCLRSLGRLNEALAKYETALEMSQRLFPADHPHVARCLNNVAYCLQSLGRPSEALAKYESALQMYQRLFPDDHPHVATNLNNVAGCLRSLGRSSEALSTYESALAMRRRILDRGHPDILATETTLGDLLVDLLRFAEAEALLLDTVEELDQNQSAPPGLHRGCLEGLVKLYDARHAAEPDGGDDARAAAWRTRLDALRQNAPDAD
jgi:serine/threonine protein kinase/Tfp pilus assembly protein PilF